MKKLMTDCRYCGVTLLVALMVGVFSACSANAKGGAYTVTADFPAQYNEHMAYITDYDTQTKIDSVMISDSKAVFRGNVEYPLLARLTVGNDRVGMFILEPGDITFNTQTRQAKGTALNERLESIGDSINTVMQVFETLNPADSTYNERVEALQDHYRALMQKALDDNADNPIGYYIFIQDAYEMNLAELNEALEKYPTFKESQQVIRLKDTLSRRHETSAGHKYKDFEAEYDGKMQRLSEYVRPGEYTLVDFWASWCGPCIKEIKTLKALKEKYGDRLNVVGVAVWDEPENTLNAIRRLDIQWPVMMNTQTVATDLYGIPGIPCIMLIGPDGTILSRDKQGHELVNDVDAALAQ